MLWAHLNRHSTRTLQRYLLRQQTRSFTQTAFPCNFSATPLLRQQLPLSSVQDATRVKYGEAFTQKIGKPHIRNQVLVSKSMASLYIAYEIKRFLVVVLRLRVVYCVFVCSRQNQHGN